MQRDEFEITFPKGLRAWCAGRLMPWRRYFSLIRSAPGHDRGKIITAYVAAFTRLTDNIDDLTALLADDVIFTDPFNQRCRQSGLRVFSAYVRDHRPALYRQ